MTLVGGMGALRKLLIEDVVRSKGEELNLLMAYRAAVVSGMEGIGSICFFHALQIVYLTLWIEGGLAKQRQHRRQELGCGDIFPYYTAIC